MEHTEASTRRLNSMTKRGNVVKEVLVIQKEMNTGLNLIKFTFDDADARTTVLKKKEEEKRMMQNVNT